MRAGLKNAQYIAFTGTPLLGRERKTNAWFGDYVSEYNFQQSVDDGATVPLFYKKRVPEVLIQNDDLSEELAEICEDENLDEAQQEKLERDSRRRSRSSSAMTAWRPSPRTSSITSRGAAIWARAWSSPSTNSPP